MSKIMYKDKQILGCISDSKYAAYDNTGTGLSATNAQDAITELNGKLQNICITIRQPAQSKKNIIDALNTYNDVIPSGICIVNFYSKTDGVYYSGVITQKLNNTYGLGIALSYYNNSTMWVRLENRIWKDA